MVLSTDIASLDTNATVTIATPAVSRRSETGDNYYNIARRCIGLDCGLQADRQTDRQPAGQMDCFHRVELGFQLATGSSSQDKKPI